MPRSVLLLLSQNPLDPASGAARTLDAIARLLAGEGFSVAALGTTAQDGPAPAALADLLGSRGVAAHVDAPGRADRGAVIRFRDRRVDYTLLETGAARSTTWDAALGGQFGELLDAHLRARRPEVVLTMGASGPERARQARCRAAGAAVVLGVRQHGYYHPDAFTHVDAVLTCSRYLTECYRARVGVDSTPIPSPIDPVDVVAPERTAACFTFVNPIPEKGVFFFARLAETLAVRRPDVPLLVVQSRGTARTLMEAGRAGGFDLSRHGSVMVTAPVAQPRQFFHVTRALLAPSAWGEPMGRVAIEAFFNGLPPVVSDRGGLVEVCEEGGFVRALPPGFDETVRTPPPEEAVMAWVELIERLADDEAFYAGACERARLAARRYEPAALTPRYVEYFRRVSRRR